ncbi:helix-turn-helix domain-containing protein [Labedella endophytica]|uniref:Helix-turn-helix domain-containing protein n=2 Tax=Labedella endophytica TaxID=1523160 RepID=A0A433JV39_9MICO|nr:helix-turn-helix domain-containing protein [Labedella endophytica]
MAAMSYSVKVTREHGQWIADVVDLDGAHTYAGNLPSLDAAVREVIALVENLPDGTEPALELDWDYSGASDAVRTAAAVGALRAEADVHARALAERTREQIVLLAAERHSVRDIARLLGISPGRVSQLQSSSASRDAVEAEASRRPHRDAS